MIISRQFQTQISTDRKLSDIFLFLAPSTSAFCYAYPLNHIFFLKASFLCDVLVIYIPFTEVRHWNDLICFSLMQHWSLKLQGLFCHTWNICRYIYIKEMNEMWINDFIWDHKKGIESNMKHIWQIIWSSYVLYMRFICDDCGLCLVSPCHALFKYKKSVSTFLIQLN